MKSIKSLLNENFFRLFVVIGAVCFMVHYCAQKSVILVIHSYNTDYPWVKDINKGIDRVLEKQKSYIVVKYHYMDTKNHPKQEDIVKAGKISQEIISILKPSIIIAIDDDAQKYVARHYVNHPDIRLVFAGVNSQIDDYGYKTAKNVTGYLERIPIDAVVDFLTYVKSKITPHKKIRAVHIYDTSKTAILDNQRFIDFKNWGNIELLPSIQVKTFSDWQNAIKKSEKIADVILVSNYRKIFNDGTDKLVPADKVMKWAFENSQTLILGLNGFVTEDGAALSIGASPFEQGEEVMEMALQLFSHKKTIKELPIKQTLQYIVSVDQARYAKSYIKKGIDLPKSYEALARAVGKYMIEKGH